MNFLDEESFHLIICMHSMKHDMSKNIMALIHSYHIKINTIEQYI